MLNKLQNSTIVLSLLICFSSCAQKKESQNASYTIDSSIVSEISRKIEPFNGQANANISFVIYENDKEIVHSNEPGEAALSFTCLSDNTLMVDCLNGVNDGFGFSLVIGKDTSFIKFKVVSNNDNVLFKPSKNTILQPELLVNCSSRKVLLAHNPTFASGEVIQGKVELDSEPFYEVSNGKERRLKFRVKSYFKSEPLPVNNREYKTLKKI